MRALKLLSPAHFTHPPAGQVQAGCSVLLPSLQHRPQQGCMCVMTHVGPHCAVDPLNRLDVCRSSEQQKS